MAPKLFILTVECIKSILLSFEISKEIALFIHLNGISKMTKTLLSFNLDRDKLEDELRKYYLIRLIDGDSERDE